MVYEEQLHNSQKQFRFFLDNAVVRKTQVVTSLRIFTFDFVKSSG